MPSRRKKAVEKQIMYVTNIRKLKFIYLITVSITTNMSITKLYNKLQAMNIQERESEKNSAPQPLEELKRGILDSSLTQSMTQDMKKMEKLLDRPLLAEAVEFHEKKHEEIMLRSLSDIFHMSLLCGVLPYMNTREKMMNMLHTRGSKEWSAEQILKLAEANKITWVKGYSDPLDNETYQNKMNTRLAEILR